MAIVTGVEVQKDYIEIRVPGKKWRMTRTEIAATASKCVTLDSKLSKDATLLASTTANDICVEAAKALAPFISAEEIRMILSDAAKGDVAEVTVGPD